MSGNNRPFFPIPLPSLDDLTALANLFGFATPQQLKKAFEELSAKVDRLEKELKALKRKINTKKSSKSKSSSMKPARPL